MVFVGFLALAIVLFGSTWVHPFATVIGIGPDPPVFIWYLRWVPFAITHGMNPLSTNYLDYPAGINVMWQTSIPLLGLLLWPVTAIAGPIFSYNLLMTTSVALSGGCAFLVLRRRVRHRRAALAGSLLFAFSPYMLAESLGHPHVGVTCIIPLMVMVFEEAVIWQRRQPLKLGLLLGALAGAQLLISEEMLLTEALFAAMAIGILAGLSPHGLRSRAGYLLKVLLPAAGLLITIATWPLGVQFFGPHAIHGRLFGSNVFVEDLAGVILPTPLQAMAPPAITAITERFSGSQYEAGGYLGLPLLALLGIGARRHWHLPLVRLALLLGLLALALSFGVTLHFGGVDTAVPAAVMALAFLPLMRSDAGRFLPWIFVAAWAALAIAPVIDNVVASRLAIYVFLLASLLIAVITDGAIDQPPRQWRSWSKRMTLALAALTFIALLPAWPFPSSSAVVPRFFLDGSESDVRQAAVILVVPYAHDLESRAMLWQAAGGMWFRMPEGYANRAARSLDPAPSRFGDALIAIQNGKARPTITPAYREQVLTDLRQWDVGSVVVGPMAGQQEVVSFVSAVLGTTPESEGGVLLWKLPAG